MLMLVEKYRTYWLYAKAQTGGSRSQTLASASEQQRALLRYILQQAHLPLRHQRYFAISR